MESLGCKIVFFSPYNFKPLEKFTPVFKSRPLVFISMLFGWFNCIYLSVLLWKSLYLHPRCQDTIRGQFKALFYLQFVATLLFTHKKSVMIHIFWRLKFILTTF